MTDPEAMVFEALARGRLIFPFKDELKALRDTAANGPLTDSENERMAELVGAFEQVKIKDKWFHSAMEGGDTETARRVAEEALEICEQVAG